MGVNRRRIAYLAALLAASLCGCSKKVSEDAPKRPADVVLVVFDTQRKDRLSCYGYGRPTSPFIDKVAARGVVFEDATAQSSWTRPSMVSLFSGQYLTEYRDKLEPETPTLAEAFRDAGYVTIGTTGNMLVSERAGFGRGFHVFDDQRGAAPEHERRGLGRSVDVLLEDLWHVLDGAFAHRDGEDRPPLFLYIQVMDPHHPYDAHPQYDEELPLAGPPAFEPAHWQREMLDKHRGTAPEGDPGHASVWKTMKRTNRLYDQEVRFADEHIGKLLSGLRKYGIGKKLIVAFAADHGEGLWDHPKYKLDERFEEGDPDRYFHRSHGKALHQELIGTPLILAGPGVPVGIRISAPVENIDLFPTLLELADVASPGDLHGTSLVDLMHGRAPDWRKDVHSFVVECRSVREFGSQLKLIEPTKLGRELGVPTQVFSLGEDPAEVRELSTEQGAAKERLSAKIEAWRTDYPTVSNLSRKKSKAEIQDLKALGYLDD